MDLKEYKLFHQYENVKDIVCRKTFIEKFNQKVDKTVKIKVPNSVFIEPSHTKEEIEELLDQVKYPVILKPRISCVVPNSHDLLICRDKESILQRVLKDYEFMR